MQVGGRKNKQVFDEINITPLTDIFLVLLIIMMVVAPMVNQMRADIKPPDITKGTPVEQNKLTVEVTKDGQFYVQGVETPEAELANALKAEAAKMPQAEASSDPEQPADRNVIVRADKSTRSGVILKVFEAARDAEFTKVTVAGEALSESRQSELEGQ